MTTTRSEAKRKLRRILEEFFAYRRIQVTKDDLVVWINGLIDVPLGDVETAISRFRAESQEFPTVDALRRFLPNVVSLSDDDRAKLAWTFVQQAMRSYGVYASIDFSDRIINAAVRALGGWERLCDQTIEELKWIEKEFVRHYAIIAKSGLGNGTHLAGLEERTNRSVGGKIPETRLISCGMTEHPAAAKLTYQGSATAKIGRARNVPAGLIPDLGLKDSGRDRSK